MAGWFGYSLRGGFSVDAGTMESRGLARGLMADATTLFHLSDIHFGLVDEQAIAWAAQEIAREKPDLVVMTGDLTMRARTQEFAAAREWIASLDAPVAVDIGNHDIPGYHLPERYLAPFKRFKAFKQAVERPIALPGLALVALGTSTPAQPRSNWSKGWVTRRALQKCLQEIDALPDGTQALVTAHHPLREAGTRGTAYTKNGAAALAALAQRPVLGVLSGHVHDGFDLLEETDNGPVRMIGAGTLSQRLRSTPPSFNILRWDGAAIKVEQRQLLPA